MLRWKNHGRSKNKSKVQVLVLYDREYFETFLSQRFRNIELFIPSVERRSFRIRLDRPILVQKTLVNFSKTDGPHEVTRMGSFGRHRDLLREDIAQMRTYDGRVAAKVSFRISGPTGKWYYACTLAPASLPCVSSISFLPLRATQMPVMMKSDHPKCPLICVDASGSSASVFATYD
jgi:hypothetical protein